MFNGWKKITVKLSEVEGEQEGGEVGKVVRSQSTCQPCMGKGK